MWVRQDTESFYRTLVDEYNRTQDVQIRITPIRQQEFVTKVSTAASAGDLPDILSTDVAFSKRFIDADIYKDIADRIQELPYANELLPAYVDISTEGDSVFGVPAAVDASTIFYNKTLFKKAGLVPEKPPSDWAEIEKAAEAVTGLGNGIHGFYFAGGCGGCNAFDMLPMVWAQGGDVVDGSEVTVDSPEVRNVLEFYNRMWEKGDIPPSAKTDTGETWITAFATGKIGIAPYGSFAVSALNSEAPNVDYGVFLIPGPDGETSSFAGGDAMGLTNASSNDEAAWGFIKWMLSDDTQVNIVAKNNFLVDRKDLSHNRYAKANPAIEIHNAAASIGKIPNTAYFNELFTNANGPWNETIQEAVFQGDVDNAVTQGEQGFEQIIQAGG
jgi:multiple sugar transport system substrate-binding protein